MIVILSPGVQGTRTEDDPPAYGTDVIRYDEPEAMNWIARLVMALQATGESSCEWTAVKLVAVDSVLASWPLELYARTTSLFIGMLPKGAPASIASTSDDSCSGV